MRIIITPALPSLAQLGIAFSLLVIAFGLLAEPPKDHNRLRYLAASLQLEAIAKAVEVYRDDCGEYPPLSVGLNALVLDQGIKCWRGPYLPKSVPLDPWGTPYMYSLPPYSNGPEILSYGADRMPGGTFFNADISSRHLTLTVPDSPSEVRLRHVFLGVWIGAWLLLIASLIVLRRSRLKAQPH